MTARATLVIMEGALTRSTGTSAPVNQDTQEKCAISTLMTVPSIPVAMVERALMESMDLRVYAERATMTPPVNHSSTNVSATLVFTDAVRTKSMAIIVFVTRAGAVSTVTSTTMNVNPTRV